MHSPPLSVREDRELSPQEHSALGEPATLAHFAHYARHSTTRTRLFLAKVYDGARFLGAAPIARLSGQRSTDLLRPEARRWMGPLLGWSSRRTTGLIDTSFLGYAPTSPFLCPHEADRPRVRAAVIQHLQSSRAFQVIWISEPTADPDAVEIPSFDPFPTLPLAVIDLEGCRTVEEFLARQSKKRRKNWRADRRVMEEQGGVFEHYTSPIPESVLREMHHCLLASATHNDLCVPYADLMNDWTAFAGLHQQVIVVRHADRVVGFFGWFENDGALRQCHGGFDHVASQQVHAYPNVLNQAVETALTRGDRSVSLGPLNNETKRRAASHLIPMTSRIWCRDLVTRWFVRHVFLQHFQVSTRSTPVSLET